MVFAQTREESVLAGVAASKAINGLLLSKESDRERMETVRQINRMTTRILTAAVSYVGKADYREAEQYIRDFRLWTSPRRTAC